MLSRPPGCPAGSTQEYLLPPVGPGGQQLNHLEKARAPKSGLLFLIK